MSVIDGSLESLSVVLTDAHDVDTMSDETTPVLYTSALLVSAMYVIKYGEMPDKKRWLKTLADSTAHLVCFGAGGRVTPNTTHVSSEAELGRLLMRRAKTMGGFMYLQKFSPLNKTAFEDVWSAIDESLVHLKQCAWKISIQGPLATTSKPEQRPAHIDCDGSQDRGDPDTSDNPNELGDSDNPDDPNDEGPAASADASNSLSSSRSCSFSEPQHSFHQLLGSLKDLSATCVDEWNHRFSEWQDMRVQDFMALPEPDQQRIRRVLAGHRTMSACPRKFAELRNTFLDTRKARQDTHYLKKLDEEKLASVASKFDEVAELCSNALCAMNVAEAQYHKAHHSYTSANQRLRKWNTEMKTQKEISHSRSMDMDMHDITLQTIAKNLDEQLDRFRVDADVFL